MTNINEEIITAEISAVDTSAIYMAGELTPDNLLNRARELSNQRKLEEAAACYEEFLETEHEILSSYADACIELADCYVAMDKGEKVLGTLIRGFEYGAPRADICCRIGYHYKSLGYYQIAIIWFNTATKIKNLITGTSAENPDYADFIPNIEMAECFYKLGEVSEAVRLNEKAAEYKPDNPRVLSNRAAFRG